MRALRHLSLVLLFLSTAPLWAADTAEDQFFDSNGTQIRYTVEGQGEPVVLIHGFTSSSDANWRMNGAVARLSSEFQVIALDTRGHGKSGKPHDPAVYGDEMVHDVARLLDHLGIEKAHIAGYSMGGFITLRMAALHPDRMMSAVLGGSGWNPPAANGEDPIAGLAESLESGKGVGPLIEALTPEGQPKPTEEQMAMINQMVLAQNDPLALAAVIRGMADITVTEDEIRGMKVPMLAIVGEIDPLMEAAEALRAVRPDMDIEMLAGRDHMTATSDPAFVSSMRDFYVELCNCA